MRQAVMHHVLTRFCHGQLFQRFTIGLAFAAHAHQWYQACWGTYSPVSSSPVVPLTGLYDDGTFAGYLPLHTPEESRQFIDDLTRSSGLVQVINSFHLPLFPAFTHKPQPLAGVAVTRSSVLFPSPVSGFCAEVFIVDIYIYTHIVCHILSQMGSISCNLCFIDASKASITNSFLLNQSKGWVPGTLCPL